MSHDGGPSPMYWVIWSVFRISRIFQVFCVQHGVPLLLKAAFGGFTAFGSFSCFWQFLGGLDEPGVLESHPGGVWMSLGMSEWLQVTGS